MQELSRFNFKKEKNSDMTRHDGTHYSQSIYWCKAFMYRTEVDNIVTF